MRQNCDNERDLDCAHLFPRVLEYKRGRDITKAKFTEVKVYSTFI